MSYFIKSFLQIGELDLSKFLHEFKTVESWKQSSAEASVKIAQRGTEFSDKIKKGDRVTVKGSCTQKESDTDWQVLFEGYVKAIKPSTEVLAVDLENEAYQLKRKPAVNASYKRIKLKDLLFEYFPEIKKADSVPDLEISNMIIREMTPYQLLEKLKESYLIEAYFRGADLYTGLPFLIENDLPTVEYDLNSGIHKDNLVFREAAEVRLKAKASSVQRDGSKISVEVGDDDGEVRSLFYRDISNEKALKEIAAADLSKLKVSGVSGDFTDFGLSFISHSYKVRLKGGDQRKNGTFWADKISTELSAAKGIERQIFLGKSAG